MSHDTLPGSSVDPVLAALDLRRGTDATTLLQQAVARAGRPAAVVVFDLDSTLLDNKPRQARILAEYGREHGIASLAGCRPEHWTGWDFRAAMRAAGLPADEVEAHVEPYRVCWRDRFFTSEYCRVDGPVPGAAPFVGAVRAAGAIVIYLTGRHEGMRDGTVESMERLALPLPDDQGVRLWMKPSLDEDDDGFKARVHADLPTVGSVQVVFDNEPTHVNDYRRSFPEALVIHLATDHSMRSILVDPGIPSITDFGAFAPQG
ncbi:HAD family hydrolase [Paraliomyxa miuraensis]|uniref:hypothetical protein n=1 Tax=Paraliomyxa miuraensis TaxID=376150 RepID=UPI002257D745|nr:hypothetical protein [Paraliomyxa miuraensis]MCX4242412.1 hypothetical protein [Paraliomyxa miuraensis]